MVYMSSSGLDWQPLLTSWFKKKNVEPEHANEIKKLFESSFFRIYKWSVSNLHFVMNVLQVHVLNTVFVLLEALLPCLQKAEEDHPIKKAATVNDKKKKMAERDSDDEDDDQHGAASASTGVGEQQQQQQEEGAGQRADAGEGEVQKGEAAASQEEIDELEAAQMMAQEQEQQEQEDFEHELDDVDW